MRSNHAEKWSSWQRSIVTKKGHYTHVQKKHGCKVKFLLMQQSCCETFARLFTNSTHDKIFRVPLAKCSPTNYFPCGTCTPIEQWRIVGLLSGGQKSPSCPQAKCQHGSKLVANLCTKIHNFIDHGWLHVRSTIFDRVSRHPSYVQICSIIDNSQLCRAIFNQVHSAPLFRVIHALCSVLGVVRGP